MPLEWRRTPRSLRHTVLAERDVCVLVSPLTANALVPAPRLEAPRRVGERPQPLLHFSLLACDLGIRADRKRAVGLRLDLGPRKRRVRALGCGRLFPVKGSKSRIHALSVVARTLPACQTRATVYSESLLFGLALSPR